MGLLVHERGGEVRARCDECRRLYVPERRELRAADRLGGRYAFICVGCVAAQVEQPVACADCGREFRLGVMARRARRESDDSRWLILCNACNISRWGAPITMRGRNRAS